MIIPGAIVRRSSGEANATVLKRARAIIVSRASISREAAFITALDIHATRKSQRQGVVPEAFLPALDLHVTRKASSVSIAPLQKLRRARLIVISKV